MWKSWASETEEIRTYYKQIAEIAHDNHKALLIIMKKKIKGRRNTSKRRRCPA